MNQNSEIKKYSISDFMKFRSIQWPYSKDFYFISGLDSDFEPFSLNTEFYAFGLIHKGAELIVDGGFTAQ